jgi:protein-tyrosine phosphatase
MDVPDPYYAGPAMFDSVLTMIETATRGLFSQLEPAVRAPLPTLRAMRRPEQEDLP